MSPDFVSELPMGNAIFNGISTLFLSIGWWMIRQGKKEAHRNCMVAALTSSTLFLIGYLIYHYHAGGTRFLEPGWFRPYYLVLLLTHIVLAVVILPLVIITVAFAIRGKFERHQKWARWTWPLWMYVSVTGVLIYLLLYQIFPQASGSL